MLRKVKKIAVAMSGGVDSSLSCLILKRKGYDVFGVYMQNWDVIDESGRCSGEEDYYYARRAAEIIGVPLKKISFEREYWNLVFSKLMTSYEHGITLNPDILCNEFIKFGTLFKYVSEKMDADWLATGHYAQLKYLCNGVKLLRAKDKGKDQTYFLCQVDNTALQKVIFPVGGLLKSEVKELAKKVGLGEIASKPESTGICFVGKRDFRQFINDFITTPKGDMVDVDNGRVVKQHDGIHLWTVGQRLNLGGQLKAYYICHIDHHSNRIYLAAGRDHPALDCQEFKCLNMKWISHDHLEKLQRSGFLKCFCQTRYQADIVGCWLESIDESHIKVILDRTLSGQVAPGQFSVFYDKEECIGGAMISESHTDYSLSLQKHSEIFCNKS